MSKQLPHSWAHCYQQKTQIYIIWRSWRQDHSSKAEIQFSHAETKGLFQI